LVLNDLSSFTRSCWSMSNTFETIPVVSSKPRLQLPLQPFIRCIT
jgi:hypothetical protein